MWNCSCVLVRWLTDWRSNALDTNEYFISGKTTLFATIYVHLDMRRAEATPTTKKRVAQRREHSHFLRT